MSRCCLSRLFLPLPFVLHAKLYSNVSNGIFRNLSANRRGNDEEQSPTKLDLQSGRERSIGSSWAVKHKRRPMQFSMRNGDRIVVAGVNEIRHCGRASERTDARKRECEKRSPVNNDNSGTNVRKRQRRAAYGLRTRCCAPRVKRNTGVKLAGCNPLCVSKSLVNTGTIISRRDL